MGLFADYRRNRRRANARDQAWHYRRAGRLAEAAEIYELMAAEVRADHELIYEDEINTALVVHNMAPRFQVTHSKFPALCPHRGGALPLTYADASVTCSFCGSVIQEEPVHL